MRYAIYFTPPADSPLIHAANHWLGRDAFRDVALQQPEEPAFPVEELAELTADPRRYGFHATLKAPFDLQSSRTAAELETSFQAFCEVTRAFDIPRIVLGQLGAFFALVPDLTHDPLQRFAACVVEHFEPFRAPLSDTDIRRRKPEKLTSTERENLDRWGYPYVFDDFRFHMTLTGQVPAERTGPMRDVLQRRFADHIDRPLTIGGLGLFREDVRGAPFTVQSWLPLSGA